MPSFLVEWFKTMFPKKNKESIKEPIKDRDFPVEINGEEIIFSLVYFGEVDINHNIPSLNKITKVNAPAFIFVLKHIKKIRRFACDEELDAFLKRYHDKIKDCKLIIAFGNHDRTGRGFAYEEGVKRIVPTGDFIFPSARNTECGLVKEVYVWADKLPPKGTFYLVVR